MEGSIQPSPKFPSDWRTKRIEPSALRREPDSRRGGLGPRPFRVRLSGAHPKSDPGTGTVEPPLLPDQVNLPRHPALHDTVAAPHQEPTLFVDPRGNPLAVRVAAHAAAK